MSELLGYSLKRAQLKVFEDFLHCVAPLQLTPAQFSVLLLLDKNPGRNQTEIASTLGILRPNFVAMLDGLESRELCARMRSTNDRRSHILVLTDKGRAVLARAKKLVAAKHEARLRRASKVVLLPTLQDHRATPSQDARSSRNVRRVILWSPAKPFWAQAWPGSCGRKSGVEPNFNYSPAMKQAALTWGQPRSTLI